jgi:hypothetical protein
VPARRRRFEDEAVHLAVGLVREGRRERVGRHDRQELRPVERRIAIRAVLARIDGQILGFAGRKSRRVELHRGGLVLGERIEDARNLFRNTGSHQDVVDAREHRAIKRREVRHLDLRQQIDSDRPVVPLLRQVDLDEVGQHGDALAQSVRGLPVHREEAVGLARLPPLRAEVAAQDLG